MLGPIKAAAKKLPYLRGVIAERDRLRADLAVLHKDLLFVQPGHFYSPIPSVGEVREDEARIFAPAPRTIPGVDLREAEQLALLNEFLPFYRELPFPEAETPPFRYWYTNPAYGHCDAIFLHCMIRKLRPKRIVEVGSGHSSCMIVDTNERWFGGSIETTHIEPHPELLKSLVSKDDLRRMRIVPSRLQDAPAAEFAALAAGDILFIDSTHVSKIGSDVNRVFFEILPMLAPGVHVHFHDIFYPFEYPKEWVYEGRAWNEAYVLRAFLQYSAAFAVELMNSFLIRFHEPFFREQMPLCLKNPGASIWLKKL